MLMFFPLTLNINTKRYVLRYPRCEKINTEFAVRRTAAVSLWHFNWQLIDQRKLQRAMLAVQRDGRPHPYPHTRR